MSRISLVLQCYAAVNPDFYSQVLTAAGEGAIVKMGYSPNHNVSKVLVTLPLNLTEATFMDTLDNTAINTPANVKSFGFAATASN